MLLRDTYVERVCDGEADDAGAERLAPDDGEERSEEHDAVADEFQPHRQPPEQRKDTVTLPYTMRDVVKNAKNSTTENWDPAFCSSLCGFCLAKAPNSTFRAYFEKG